MSSIDGVELGAVDAAAEECRPLPLGVALPLICGLSISMWIGIVRLVELAMMR